MPERPVDCPSAFQGRVRALKGKEMRILSDRQRMRSGTITDDLLAACWLETTDKGPYGFDGKPDWGNVLLGDRFYVLVQLRLATYPGETYPFQVQCRSCSGNFEWEIDLDKLPVKKLTDAGRQHLKTGVPLEVTIDGVLVKYRLPLGLDERKGARFLRGSNPDVLRALALRIVEIDGVDRSKTIEWLEDREFASHRALVEAFDEHDCGIETTIEVECTHCGLVQELDLPFGPDFLMPRKRRTQKK